MKKKSRNQKSPVTTKSNKEEPEKLPFRTRLWNSVKSFAWALLIFYFVQTFFLQAFTIPTSSMVSTLLVGDFIFVNKFIYGAQTPENIPFTDIKLPRYRFPSLKEPKQGDVVVFRFPHPELEKDQKGLDYIKRCVAVGGQTVEIRNKELYVDNKKFIDEFPIKGIHYNPLQLKDRRAFPASMGDGINFGPFRVPAKGDTILITKDNADLIRYLSLRDGQTFEIRAGSYFVNNEQTNIYIVGQNYYFMMGDNRDNSLDSRYWGPVPRDHIMGEGLLVYWSNVEAAKQTNLLLKIISTLNLAKVNWGRIGTIVR